MLVFSSLCFYSFKVLCQEYGIMLITLKKELCPIPFLVRPLNNSATCPNRIGVRLSFFSISCIALVAGGHLLFFLGKKTKEKIQGFQRNPISLFLNTKCGRMIFSRARSYPVLLGIHFDLNRISLKAETCGINHKTDCQASITA